MSKRNNLSYDDGMMIGKTQDASRVQTALYAMFYLPQFLLILMAFLSHIRGRWASAAGCFLAILARWGVRWVVWYGLPRLTR